MPTDYSYVAKPPVKKTPQKGKFNPEQQRMMDRVLGRVQLPNFLWDNLLEDLKKKEPKNDICNKYRIRPADLKWIKRYLGY